jgi:hypothetical protein
MELGLGFEDTVLVFGLPYSSRDLMPQLPKTPVQEVFALKK